MNCITKLNILLRLTNPDTIFVLYAASRPQQAEAIKSKRHIRRCAFTLKQSAYKGITSSPKCKELRQLPDAET